MNTRVVLFQAEKHWIAQGLELDLCVQGDTRDAACERFCRTFRAEVALRFTEQAQPIPPAPKRFFSLYEEVEAGDRWFASCDLQVSMRPSNNIPPEVL